MSDHLKSRFRQTLEVRSAERISRRKSFEKHRQEKQNEQVIKNIKNEQEEQTRENRTEHVRKEEEAVPFDDQNENENGCQIDDILIGQIRNIQSNSGKEKALYTVQTSPYDLILDLHPRLKNDKEFLEQVDLFYIISQQVRPYMEVKTTANQKNENNDWKWHVLYLESNGAHLSPFAQNRLIKVCAGDFFGCYQTSLYIDANVQLLRNPLSLWSHALESSDFAAFQHPHRDDAFQEMYHVEKNQTICPRPDLLRSQRDAYVNNGFTACIHTDHIGGLTWNNILFRRHTGALNRAMHIWFDEIMRFGQRDQLSLGYALWRANMRPTVIPLLKINDWLGGRELTMTKIKDQVAEHSQSMYDTIVNSDIGIDKDGVRFEVLRTFFTRPFGGSHVRKEAGFEGVECEVVLVHNDSNTGSNVLRGSKVCRYLQNLGVISTLVSSSQLVKLLPNWETNSTLRGRPCVDMVVIIGRVFLSDKQGQDILARLKKTGACIVFDIIDKYCELHAHSKQRAQLNLSCLHSIDGFMCPTRRTSEVLSKTSKNVVQCAVIQHQWDERYLEKGMEKEVATVKPKTGEDVVFGYLGGISSHAENCAHMEELVCLHGLRVIDSESGFDFTNEVLHGRGMERKNNNRQDNIENIVESFNRHPFNCHVSIRRKGTPEWEFNPGTKVATAACLDSPIVTTRDAGAMSLLPDHYPYYIVGDGHDINGIVSTLNFVKQTYCQTEWFEALNIMQEVKAKTCMSVVFRSYTMFLVKILKNRHMTKNKPTQCRVVSLPSPNLVGICSFAMHVEKQTSSDDVCNAALYVRELATYFLKIIISVNDNIPNELLEVLSRECGGVQSVCAAHLSCPSSTIMLMRVPNTKSLDFGKHWSVIRLLAEEKSINGDFLASIGRIALINDSCRIVRRLKETFEWGSERQFWGMTLSDTISPHIQSFFLIFSGRKSIMALLDFWKNNDARRYDNCKSKFELIRAFEIGLSTFMAKQGFDLEARFTYESICSTLSESKKPAHHKSRNVSFGLWDGLLEAGCPIVKKKKEPSRCDIMIKDKDRKQETRTQAESRFVAEHAEDDEIMRTLKKSSVSH